ncbi:hypothetical protein HDC93_002901 [Streptomyces sp. AK010]|nr:hypothetical protein [Streptomyces sp. AK010]
MPTRTARTSVGIASPFATEVSVCVPLVACFV